MALSEQTLVKSQLPYSVGPLPAEVPFGATVLGLRAEHLLREDVRKALHDLWIDVGVILFRDGDSDEDFHIALSECFGPHQRHVFEEALVAQKPELTRVRYYPEDGSIYDVGGKLLGGWIPWHSDLKYTDKINRGGILRPVQLPAKGGGMTGFIDLISAYQALPQDLRERIETLNVVYEMDINEANQRFGLREPRRLVRFTDSGRSIMSRRYEFPRILHPMVYRQKETGRPVLNVSPWFAVGLYEDGSSVGDELLETVMGYCVDERQAYFHDWRETDLVLWDNWRTLHSSSGIAPDDTRVMRRTTLAGDYALGRKLPEGTKLPKFDV